MSFIAPIIYPEPAELTIVDDGKQLELEYPNLVAKYEITGHAKFSINTENIYRPIQYLGAKFRPLPIILAKTIETIKPNTYVLDLFSGSTLVSQVFNSNGLQVISNDSLKFNAAFARTLLNIDRKESDLELLKLILRKLESYSLPAELVNPFHYPISEEKRLLAERQTEKLLQLYKVLPQVGKFLFSTRSINDKQIEFIRENSEQYAFKNPPLIANYYAGSYFSIFQALELDRIRNGIAELYAEGEISNWQYYFLLTCLLNVSSKIVYTAGKHFAQPIRQENILKTEILHKRFYEDRLKVVWDEFLKSYCTLNLVSERNFSSSKNIALSKEMEEVISDISTLPPTSVIYADPPYTAQQYSRYYHIPEVIFNYKYPKLQVVDGKVTSGLYPQNKFKSRFCSKTYSYFAFIDLFKLAASLKSSLLVSYSSSLTEETGNSRMIELEQIIELGSEYLPKCDLEVLKFNFKYRQLNTSKKIVRAKDDKEFLIVFKQPSL
jgi:adenine-specific DNA-methyltransferase